MLVCIGTFSLQDQSVQEAFGNALVLIELKDLRSLLKPQGNYSTDDVNTLCSRRRV